MVKKNDLVNYATSLIDRGIDVDGVNGPQCMDFTVHLMKKYYGWHPTGNAINLVSQSIPAGFSRFQVSNATQIKAGDILVWGTYWNAYGHTGIAVEDGSSNGTFKAVEQNWNNPNWQNGSPAQLVTHNMTGIWGVIRPPFEAEGTKHSFVKIKPVAANFGPSSNARVVPKEIKGARFKVLAYKSINYSNSNMEYQIEFFGRKEWVLSQDVEGVSIADPAFVRIKSIAANFGPSSNGRAVPSGIKGGSFKVLAYNPVNYSISDMEYQIEFSGKKEWILRQDIDVATAADPAFVKIKAIAANFGPSSDGRTVPANIKGVSFKVLAYHPVKYSISNIEYQIEFFGKKEWILAQDIDAASTADPSFVRVKAIAANFSPSSNGEAVPKEIKGGRFKVLSYHPIKYSISTMEYQIEFLGKKKWILGQDTESVTFADPASVKIKTIAANFGPSSDARKVPNEIKGKTFQVLAYNPVNYSISDMEYQIEFSGKREWILRQDTE